MTNTKEEQTKEGLERAVSAFVDPDGSFAKKLEKKAKGEYDKDIIVKLGIDPTRPDIHLGFAVVLRKLRQFQDLGCKVVFIVGDFTAQIGDPEGKSKVRPEIDQKTVEENARTYIDQVGKILKTDPEHFSWIRNSDWFYSPADLVAPPNVEKINIEMVAQTGEKNTISINPDSLLGKTIYYENTRMQKTHLGKASVSSVTLRGLLATLRRITHSALVARDMFQKRIKKGNELYMHEMLYPVLQGIDSLLIALIYGSCDLEIGGADQHFNMLMGREVMKVNGQEPQSVMTMEILEGTDGKEKMSKSLDNYIAITESPEEMFGKVMSITDQAITNYFRLATYTSLHDISKIEKELVGGKINPKDIKARLAKEIVEIYHGKEASEKAEQSFEKTFKNKEMPENAPAALASVGEKLVEVLLGAEVVSSKTNFRRLIAGGAIEDASCGKIDDPDFVVKENMKLKIGKKRFLKIIVK